MSGVMLGPSVPAKRTACTGKSGWSAEATVARGRWRERPEPREALARHDTESGGSVLQATRSQKRLLSRGVKRKRLYSQMSP